MKNALKIFSVLSFLALGACCSTTAATTTSEDYVCEEEVVATSVNLAGFKFDSYQLTPSMKKDLMPVVQMLLNQPEYKVTAKGYTDNVGTKEYNVKLSEKRAMSVARALISQGVDPQRITIEAFGYADPVASNDTESGRAQNRRVVLDFFK